MVINIPCHRHFPDSLTKKGVEKTGWEISVTQRDDIAWSVVLFYLKTTKYKNKKDDFKTRVETLTGQNEISSIPIKLAKRAILNYNPFRNRYSCFYDQTLKWIVEEFKKNLNWNLLIRISDKLLAAANLLSCQILQIQNGKIYKINQISPTGPEISDFAITLIFSPVVDKEDINRGTVCNFILSTDFCSKLRISALMYFLREAEISKKNIHKIKNLANEDHFLISLLRSEFRNVVLDIYKSPYIVKKLSEATYQTDPRLTDNEGLSGLYHAVLTGDSKIYYILYYFAANSCFETKGSFRNPDVHIVNNFYHLQNILSDDLSKSKDLSLCKNRDAINESFDEIVRLNTFLLEINQKILNINDKINYYDKKEDLFEAHKRKDIIVSILDTYQSYFESVKEENDKISALEDYVRHKNFYYSGDITMAIIFFGKIFHLKERLSVEKTNSYSKIESSLFNLVLYNIIWDELLPSWKEEFSSKKFPKVSSFDTLYAFLFRKRLEVHNDIKQFKDYLQDIVIDKKNVVHCLPESEVYAILNSLPVVKDFLQILRFDYYLETAQQTKITDIKSVLVIERVLQVIGEYIYPEKDNDFSMRHILPLCVPTEVTHILHRLRHEMSHLKGHQFYSKINFEKDYNSFKIIKKEIFRIKRSFQPVFRVQELQLWVYISKELQESHKYTQMYSERKFHLCEGLLVVINDMRKEKFAKYIRDYRFVLECIINSLEKEINKEELWKHKVEHIMSTLQTKVQLLSCLTELLSYYREGCKEDLLKEIEFVKNKDNFTSSLDAKDKFLHLLRRYRTFLLKFFPQSKKEPIKVIEKVENIEKFLKILRGFTFLSDEEKCKIMKEVPLGIRESVTLKKTVKKSIEDGFSLKMEEQFTEFKKLYLTNKQLKKLHEYYQGKKDLEALEILNEPGPLEELEKTFSTNSIDKKKFELLCEKMKFSEEVLNILRKLVSGQKQKIVKSNVEILLNRIKLLKEILIEENKEIFYLWNKIKSKQSQQFFFGKLVQRYLEERQFRAAVEMLLFDCMMLVGHKIEKKSDESERAENDIGKNEAAVKKCHGKENYKSKKSENIKPENQVDGNRKPDEEIDESEEVENESVQSKKDETKESKKDTVRPWIKTSKLYSGADLRNVISHGNPLLENLCLLLDPDDLPSAIIKEALRLINKEAAIEIILQRHRGSNCDPYVLSALIFTNDENQDDFLRPMENVITTETTTLDK